MGTNKQIAVEIAYASCDAQRIFVVYIEEGSTLETVIHRSKLLDHFPEIDLTIQKVGIFSKQKKLTDLVVDGDRIEIYRPLLIDPKEARRKRAKKISNQ